MLAQIGYFDTLKSVAGKVFTYLSTITLTGTDGKTLTLTQDTSLDEAVAMSSKAAAAQPAWTAASLVNDWVNYNAFYSQAGYLKDTLGFVHIRGIVKSGTADLIFTLSEDYRPLKITIFTITRNDLFANLIVNSDGTVVGTAAATSLIMDGIVFSTQ